jgi:hypothetical protein
VNELTREQAVALYKSGFWEEIMSYEERAKFQTLQERLCMPVEVYSEAMAKFLRRPVRLMREVFGGAGPPTFDEILRLIPREKLVVLES